MAYNKQPTRDEEWRKNIQTSMLINVLKDNALGKEKTPLTPIRQRSIEILLKKTIPDLKAVEVSGTGDEGQVIVEIVKYGAE